VRGELAVEFGEQHDAVGEAIFGARGGERGIFAGVAPLTTKLAPGSVWNRAASEGSLIQSCAQATRARNVSAASGLSSSRRSKRPPNSLRVSVALRELKPSAKPPALRSVSL
jgi:hypothetical protein